MVERLGYVVGVFSWFMGDTQYGLLLVPSPDSYDPRVPRYNIGVMNTDGAHRLISLGNKPDSFELFGKAVTVQWREVYLAHRAQPGMEPEIITRAARILMSFSMYAPFRFSQRNVAEFIMKHGNLQVVCRSNPVAWTGAEPLEIPFTVRAGGRPRDALRLRLGRCTKDMDTLPDGAAESQPPEAHALGRHWARLDLPGPDAPTELREHDCSADHVHNWPDMTTTLNIPVQADVLTYGRSRSMIDGIVLSVTPYALKPQDTFVIKLTWRQPPKDTIHTASELVLTNSIRPQSSQD